MKLHGFPPSPNNRKVLAVAAQLDLPLEVEWVSLVKGEQRSAAFLELNPNGRTPAFTDGEVTLWESNAILHYLVTRKPNDLWPDNGTDQADVLRWLYWEQSEWRKGFGGLYWENMLKRIFGLGEPDPAAVDTATTEFRRCATVLEKTLSKQPWLAHYGLSLADFAIAAPLDNAARCKIPLAEFPHLAGWYHRIAALPAWQSSLPEQPAA